jgi:hypothetical protein
MLLPPPLIFLSLPGLSQLDCNIFVAHRPITVVAADLIEAVHNSSPHPVHIYKWAAKF